MNLRRRFLAFGCAVATTALGCSEMGSTPPGPTPPDSRAALTALPRDLTAAERGVLSASNAFSFALWSAVNAAQPDSNVFISPLSASFSLGMAVNGAAGTTYDEMRGGLQFGNASLSSIDSGYKTLIGLLEALDPGVTMQIANSIWYRDTFPFLETFLNTDRTFFDATVKPLNFDDVPGSLTTINSWVNSQTNGRIPSVLNSIDASDVMFLMNAIYFKGSWRARFDSSATQSAPFHGIGGDQPAKLMHRNATMAYAATGMYQAVDLPYGDSAFTMTVVLPKAGTDVGTVAGAFTTQSWHELSTSFHTPEVDLYLPRLTISWDGKLIPALQTLGMHTPFIANGADFTNMSPLGKQLNISQVRQKTFVDVNEEGTEAAAVTVTGVVATSVQVPIVMRVDRPFVFVIRERLSGTVLFMGKVVRLPAA